MKRRFVPIAIGAALGAALAFTGPSFATEYPSGPIEFVIPFGAGGGADLEGRLLAKEMEKHLGVKLIPVLLTGISLTPRCFSISLASKRPSRSAPPPAPNGITNSIGPDG